MNKQELENEEVRQEEKKTKKKKVRKKKTMFGHIRSIISILLVVGIIGGSYWYYAFQYRAEVEPETNRKVTNTDSVYTMEQYLKTLKRNQFHGYFGIQFWESSILICTRSYTVWI